MAIRIRYALIAVTVSFAAGIWISAHLLGLAATGGQTLNGQAILSWSALPIAAAVFFLISLAAGVAALRRAVRTPRTGGS